MKFFFQVLTILLLCFLFIGKPTLWEALHERAMEAVHTAKSAS